MILYIYRDKGGITLEINHIINKCKAGEKDAFRELFSIVEKKSFHTAFLICHDHGLTEDILQETYLDCFKHIHKLKDPTAFHSWFYKILIRNSWKLVKSHRKVRLTSVEDQELEPEKYFTGLDSIQENQIMQTELEYMLLKHIQKLSPKTRIPIVLYYFNELSIEEISQIQGCLTATVKSRLYYGRQQLKVCLRPYMNEDVSHSLLKQKEVHQ